MFRRLTFTAVLAASLLSVLALAGSALAAPSTPVLAALPFYVNSDQTVAWSPSTLDSNASSSMSAYQFTLLNLTSGGPQKTAYRAFNLPTTTKLNTLFPGISQGKQYALCVRTVEVTTSYQVLLSLRTCEVFHVVYKLNLARIVNQYVEWNPDPGCIMCGVAEAVTHDPVIYEHIKSAAVRNASPITGARIDARGEVAIVTG